MSYICITIEFLIDKSIYVKERKKYTYFKNGEGITNYCFACGLMGGLAISMVFQIIFLKTDIK